MLEVAPGGRFRKKQAQSIEMGWQLIVAKDLRDGDWLDREIWTVVDLAETQKNGKSRINYY